ncbi:MAG: twin-arginine translocation signal domain-containing protein [Gemmatimonadales bacterium]|nr:MAG: twin-arginine translocation signal domain-containing protein [Gemmatimonadales bacterium]
MISTAPSHSVSRRDLLRAAAVGSTGVAAAALPLPTPPTEESPRSSSAPGAFLRRAVPWGRDFPAPSGA